MDMIAQTPTSTDSYDDYIAHLSAVVDVEMAALQNATCQMCGRGWSPSHPIDRYPGDADGDWLLCLRCGESWLQDLAGEAGRRAEAIEDARQHIRAALRELDSLETTLLAYATDDQFGQPNRATAAAEALMLALDALDTLEGGEA